MSVKPSKTQVKVILCLSLWNRAVVLGDQRVVGMVAVLGCSQTKVQKGFRVTANQGSIGCRSC